MRRFVSVATGVVGILVSLAGIALLISTLGGLKPEDEGVALSPLATVPLDSIAKQSSSTMDVVIPDTAQWRRIRRKWGVPEFIISAVSSNHNVAYCPADLKMRIEVYQQGTPVHTHVSGAPYGISSYCEGTGLRFSAAPGTELRVVVSRLVQSPLPTGEIIVVAYWPDTKDKLVGNALDKELRPIAIAVSVFGVALIALAVLIGRRRAVKPSQPER